jgi:4-hydroxyproline epimerase
MGGAGYAWTLNQLRAQLIESMVASGANPLTASAMVSMVASEGYDEMVARLGGIETAQLHPDGSVTVANVASYRHAHHVALTLPDGRSIHGDVAWGGNWFFLCHDHGYDLHHDTIATLTQAANTIRQALVSHGITGADNAEIDHIELFGPAAPGADSRSFVLCPGDAYDRSPCGTGTSAKLACLAADELLAPDQEWIQESIIGSRFQACYRRDDAGQIWPLITGRAYVTMVGQIITEIDDPFSNGIQR